MDARYHRFMVAGIALLLLALFTGSNILPTPTAAAAGTPVRLLVQTRSLQDHVALRAQLAGTTTQIVSDHPEINLIVVVVPSAQAETMLGQNARVSGVARDGVRQLIRPSQQQELLGKSSDGKQTRIAIDGSKLGAPSGLAPTSFTPDPAFSLTGLMWNVNRIGAPLAWQRPLGTGYQSIKVGVADTGLDYTHLELVNKVDSVVDFTLNEQPNICSTFFGLPTDQQLATAFGAPSSNLDFHGHGTWIGGNIAASANMTGTNGIAPGVQLVSLKISQNCGAAYDSEIIDAFMYAANNGIDIVSISFGGYLNRSDPEQDLIYRFYRRTVTYARSRGTLIIAAAGNEHARVALTGQVVSHGILDVPPGGTDYYHLWETPGGIPGVVMVSATGNVVNAASATCPADSLAAGSHQWCKLSSEAHQPFGVGKLNQLTYYSNYGPRIDFSAPGGARKFNIPAIDNGGCEGWPWCGVNSVEGGTSAADGYNAWEDFSITSNYATEIPCFTFTGSLVFPENQCYAIIQGTSMATPHVSAVAALALSRHPEALKNPAALYNLLLNGVVHLLGNTTPPVSKTDTTGGDRTGGTCPGGFCHLGGTAITSRDAYGKGFISAINTVKLP